MFHLFETLVQPILLYGSDIWGSYTQCTKDIDTVFMWFIRGVLRIKPTTCNIITIGEAGMIPPSVKCHENVVLNFIRLNCMSKGSVVKSIFDELQSFHNVGIKCWYSGVLELGKTYGIDPLSYDYSESTKRNIKTIFRNHFIRNWKLDIQNHYKYPILRIYNRIKHDFGYEQYMSLISNKKYRIAMTRFRASSHSLEVERGRYTIPVTPIINRLCHRCGVIEDELHFLLNCRLYDADRHTLFDKILGIHPNFTSLADPNKFVFLLSNKEARILTWVGKFIYDSFNKRTEYHSSI